MNINLVPMPKKLTITTDESYDPSGFKEIHLVMPEVEGRLKKHAKELFESVETGVNEKYFLLYSRGKMPCSMEDCKVLENADSYLLSMDTNGFCVASLSASGLFYGIQTIKQLLAHKQLPGIIIEDWADTVLRSDYLDLRTIFPPIERILYFIKELSYYKINTLVIEYEDKIPFSIMSYMRHDSDCFSEEEFESLLLTAREHYVEIIPLQQSFGHLEYALKYPEYLYLRETPETPGEMCPLREGALELSKKLLLDIASLHPESRYLHIGCDEVWSLGSSRECRESGKTRESLFIEFVNQIIAYVCCLGKIPIIWHDMFVHATEEEIALLDKRVLVAIWLYNGSDLPFIAKELMQKLDDAGISYLGCSSVRCWDNKPEQNYPDIDNRMLNLDLWGSLVDEKKIIGMIHTNWSSSFSFGRPYGLFETSRYPLIYAADTSWNLHAEKADFLYRFLFLYHGMETADLEKKGYRSRDYFRLMDSQYENVSKNRETAYLIHLMIALESCFPVQHTIFRCELFPESEVEFSCQKERSIVALQKMDKVQCKLKEFIPQILSESMSKVFLESRFYLYRLARERLETILKEGKREYESV